MKICKDCGKRKKSKKGNYCKKCGYKHRKRPSGLVYNIVKENRGWFKKGHKSWNKGTKGICKANSSSIKKGERLSQQTEFKGDDVVGEKNHNWKGDDVGYYALHQWLDRNYGRPEKCEFCGRENKVEWASKDYKYSRKREGWLHLCFWCHREYDSKNGWGMATKQFSELRK